MKKLLIAFTALALLGSVADAKGPCRDKTTGRFATCPHAATAAAAPAIKKDAKGKCHFADGPKKGKYTTCPKG